MFATFDRLCLESGKPGRCLEFDQKLFINLYIRSSHSYEPLKIAKEDSKA